MSKHWQLVEDDAGQVAPDWSASPEWANWWTVDSDGEVSYWANEPAMERYTAMWYNEGDVWMPDDSFVEIPLGIDWRTLKQRRPQEPRQAAGGGAGA